MDETLYLKQLKLEEDTRGLTIRRFEKEHTQATENNTFSETFIGSHLIGQYLVPMMDGLKSWLKETNSGKAGRRNIAGRYLTEIDSATASYLFLKALLNRVGAFRKDNPCTYTSLAMYAAGLIQDEISLRHFEDEKPHLSKKIHKDFASRELPRVKREEYMRSVFDKQEMEWNVWTSSEKLHVGSALIDIFQSISGDLVLRTMGKGRGKRLIVNPSEALLAVIENTAASCGSLMTVYAPTIIKPVEWSKDNLSYGGYFSENITPYFLVKGAKRGYRKLLQSLADDGKLDRVFDAINALQNTPWVINTRVLSEIKYVYDNNIECGKLPQADPIPIDPYPTELEHLTRDEISATDPDSPLRQTWNKYQAYRASVHEANRRIIGKRIMAQRAFHLAEQYSQYDAIYFPHDLDSRGRTYPKPAGLNPQGADYVKGLLHFKEAKRLGKGGLHWLAVHGANCYGEDKLPILERADWASNYTDTARLVASSPRDHTQEWTKADNPAQFLAWCIEWAEAHELEDPTEYKSRLHVDLDATCSGLQHFSAMLKDEVGGFHVNMTECETRQDVYGAVAKVAMDNIAKDMGTDQEHLAISWLRFGLDRKITKRSVMVKPYSGTRTSCNTYVAEAVTERISAGEPLPWPEEDMWAFMMYGAGKVWEAIPEVVVAADGAMQWLSTLARLVGKSNLDQKRIEWTTPIGFPVWQYKFNVKSRQINTFFDGKRLQPRLTENTDKLDSRQMGTSVAPSFVHSLDACHLMMTFSAAWSLGIENFAAVHDSFGTHAADIEEFSYVIREQFVEMYQNTNVLSDYLDSVLPYIDEKLHKDIPPIPETGNLELYGILDNQFFFS